MSDDLIYTTVQGPPERALVLLLLDVSSSMSEAEATGKTRIEGLAEGLQAFKEEAMCDPKASGILEVATIEFGSQANEVVPPTSIRDFDPPELTASGATALYDATVKGLSRIEAWKRDLKAQSVKYYRPIMFILTDGDPTDGNKTAASGRTLREEATLQLKDAEANKKAIVFAVSVGQQPTEALKSLCTRPPKMLAEGRWRELFQWLSASSSQASQPKEGQVPTTDPWAAF